MLEELIGRPISDGEDGHGEEGYGHLGKPAELVEDVDFGGRSIHDFMEGEDERDGIGSLKPDNDTAQSAMECEYVCS